MARGRPSKKGSILDIAQQLFAEFGYQGTSIDLVVRKAGVSKPTVYNNFPSKQVLLQSLISRQIEAIKTRHQQIVLSDANTLQKLYLILEQVISEPFELAIFKILYGEAHKLDSFSYNLCQDFEQHVENASKCVLAPLQLEQVECEVVLAVFKQAQLSNALSGKPSLPINELKAQLQVLKPLIL
ncbi:MAG: TetR/AcrR family transcriptional regulator [Oceanospirillaceae bacterium]